VKGPTAARIAAGYPAIQSIQMDFNALQQMYDAVPDDQKRKFVVDLLKWAGGFAWKRLRKSEKEKAAPEASRIVQATMADIMEYDPHRRKLISAAKRGAAKRGAPKKKAAMKRAGAKHKAGGKSGSKRSLKRR